MAIIRIAICDDEILFADKLKKQSLLTVYKNKFLTKLMYISMGKHSLQIRLK